jgi:HTH-type transcriptional regulator / antitoxin HigA
MNALPNAEPAQVLRFLMNQRDLKQIDLTSELGTKSVVSEVWSGRRQINVKQAKALAQLFSISAAVFL